MRKRNQVATKNSFITGKFYRIDVGLKSYFHKSKARISNKEVFDKLDELNVNYSTKEVTVFDMDTKQYLNL